MSIPTSFTLGLSLSMDAFAASLVQGGQNRQARWRQALRTACYFGAFEALMPVVGWALGLVLGSLMASIDHWVAFGLLLAIGVKMIRESCQRETPAHSGGTHPVRLALVAMGTSIDAAAVGVTLVVLHIPVVMAALIIGGTTFVMTCAGFVLGGVVGQRLPRIAEAGGGLLLIGIGTLILIEHTMLLG